jgi:hypothetical protein
MAKLLAFYQHPTPRHRVLLSQCDARCYRIGAEGSACDCVCLCQGKNHGVGIFQAIANSREHSDDWLAAMVGQGFRVDSVFYSPRLGQMSIFED